MSCAVPPPGSSTLLPHDQPLKNAQPDTLALSTPGSDWIAFEQLTAHLARLRGLEAIARFDRQQHQVLRIEPEIDREQPVEGSQQQAGHEEDHQAEPIWTATSDRATPAPAVCAPVAERVSFTRRRRRRPEEPARGRRASS